MADPAVAAAMAAARALLSPGDPATLVAADAHLRAVNDSPDGWRIGRALLSCAETPGDVLAPRVRVMGAAMLRAKAHADGFAMTPPDAASMTSELLAMLGTPEGSGELGPHLAQIAAAVATAGGAETLASLVNASISLAAPDSNGGWARVQDPNAPCPCGPNAHAAVALLAACAEEALHRVKAHPPETTAAARLECFRSEKSNRVRPCVPGMISAPLSSGTKDAIARRMYPSSLSALTFSDEQSSAEALFGSRKAPNACSASETVVHTK